MGIVLAILASHHLAIGALIGPSIHFKVVLIVSPSGVETDSTSVALALGGSLIVALALNALVTTLIVIPLIVVMLWGPLIVVLASAALGRSSLIFMIRIVPAVTATAAVATLISSAATASSAATTATP